jgi:endonuclease YncB( thermonuclease family)
VPREKSDISGAADMSVGFAESRLRGQSLDVVLVRPDLDPRGRYLVFADRAGEDVGLMLISAGHAAVYTEYPFTREDEYLSAEASARAASAGLWSGPATVKRLRALRQTWSAVRQREWGSGPADAFLAGDAP